MSFLRNRAGFIIIAVIGLAIVAFLFSDAVQYSGGFMRDAQNQVGEVAGQSISSEEYNQKLEQNTANFRQQSGQNELNAQVNSYIQENTWNQTVSQLILNKEISKVGLAVGTAETKTMIQGSNPNPQIVQAFSNPETGEFDRSRLNYFLSNLNSGKPGDPTRAQWDSFIKQIIQQKLAEKYLSLIRNGLYVNSLEANDAYEAKNKLAKFKYITLNYASIPDEKVSITEEDYKAFYNENKNRFKNPQELRSIDYVIFEAFPSKEDTLLVKKQIDQLAADFKLATHDSLFVAVNADTKVPVAFVRKGKLDPKIDSVMFNAPKGFIYGPVFSEGAYKLAKLVDIRIAPDSVKARHILLDPTREGGLDKALAKADSLKKLIQEGKSFDELAKTFSVDGSAAKGGELGTFGPGAMVPVFEDAVFGGKAGDLKIVTSQFGVHLIEIQKQSGSTKEIKVALVDKILVPSNKTQSAAYAKAQSFLSAASNGNFNEQVKKTGVRNMVGEDINPLAASLPGLENAREVVKWAFKVEKSKISDQVFEQGDKYVVARLNEVKEEGILPLATVKKIIEPEVRNVVKAKQLTDKLTAALNGASTLEQAAQKAGTSVVPVQNVVFANPVIPGVAQENKVIGAVFGTPPNKLSKAIAGDNGIYAFWVDSFTAPVPLTNSIKEKQQIGQALLQRSDAEVFQALKDKANVKDYRAKFF
ncbi:MAG: peptidylprolyl isomerase [Sphingobacteriaceae bacterium]